LSQADNLTGNYGWRVLRFAAVAPIGGGRLRVKVYDGNGATFSDGFNGKP